MASRWEFTGQFKARLALDALGGDKIEQAIATKRQLPQNSSGCEGSKQIGPVKAEHQLAVQTGELESVGVLLNAGQPLCSHAVGDESDRLDAHEVSFLWISPTRSVVAQGRNGDRSSPCKASMGKMTQEPIYEHPGTRQPRRQLPVFPCLLSKMQIDRPNQVKRADDVECGCRMGC